MRSRPDPRPWLGGALAAVLLAISATVGAGAPVQPPPTAIRAPVEELVVEILERHPHDPDAFTQGLVFDRGALYESTGRYGHSSLRRVDPATGEVLAKVDLPDGLFGEGLALLPAGGEGGGGEDGGGGRRLIQLTWLEGEARVWDAATFEPAGGFRYEGEGWGLCFDGRRLVMSDGSDVLTVRDRDSFEVLGRVPVTLRGRPVRRLNELECAEGWVWANVLGADELVRIDPESGEVTAIADASGLLTPGEAAAADVLNGIAHDPERGVYYLTGKLWPRMFVARFVPRK